MKKVLVGCLAMGLLVGCSSKTDEGKKEEKPKVEQKEQTIEKKQESKYPFPANSTQTGKAKLTVSTPAGSSEGGKVPVLFVKPDDFLTTVAADLSDFQGDKQTFIYVDKIFKETKQVGLRTQTDIELEENDLKPGKHSVTAIQFENDDPAAGKVVNFVEAQYEAKEGK